MTGGKELDILLENGYSASVADGIRELIKAVDDNKALAAEFYPAADEYAKNPVISISEPLQKISEISKKYGVNEYSLDLLFVINGLPYMHKRFKDKGLPDEVFYETMDDIRCKVNECIECYGVIGTFVAGWDDRFFRASCCGFGRFQYEEAEYGGDDFKLSCGKVLKAGDRYVNMHIPSRGVPLTDEIRLDSYRKAYPFFKPLFDGGIVIFGCHSWLLFEKHLRFLPEKFNIRRFMGDFELISSTETDVFEDRWRVFGRYTDLPDNELPRDTSLRAAYADWLCAGHKTGHGFGVFAFDGEKIVK